MSAARGLGAVLATAVVLVAGAPAVSAAPSDAVPCLGTATCTSGQLPDGTPYQFAKPGKWNGVVLVDMDFAAGGLTSALTASLVGRGYAVGGTTRTVTGWRIAQAIDNQAAALDRFEAAFGPARWAIAEGRSMGGFVAAGAAQVHPGRFDAAVPMCGGLGGSVGQWNQKLDTVFTLKTLLFRDTALPVTGIPADVPGAQQQWISALAGAQSTAEGRARIALASAIGQLPAWGLAADGTTTPVPAWWDAAGLENGMYLALAGGPLPYVGQAMSSRRAIEQVTGGNPSWNTGVDYGRQLLSAEPEHQLAVLRLYAEAGLDLGADLRRLAAAPRIAADPAAVATFARGIVFTGDVRVPVLTVNGTGDQISTVAQQQSYEDLARRAGHGGLVRQTYVRTAGHCTFTVGEQVAAIDQMWQRLRTGRWPDVSPRAMNGLAGDGRYVAFTPPRFNRQYAG
ncbi:alpha/beta hydrolase family protein [Lentzea sp. NPDC059081]|uniref:alpha/beta hydrolase family protein n=1 Tax=Lentzea sp. NPDC059081 TaxID=3346719 RepID=UPI003682D953